MKFAKMIFCLVGFFVLNAAVANADTYHCQVTANPGLYRQNLTWDGSVPFVSQLKYGDQIGQWRVSSIGLPGHPDYLFEIRLGNRTVLAVSQETQLKDYNLSWRSDDESITDSLINIACRLRPGA